jgi:hypothetical protein
MNNKLGYYKVGEHIFYNKLQAILYANPTKADITWHFNNEIFDKYDWTVEPPMSLSLLYAERARQLRDQFDYVIIMASGGADSTNVIKSFLDNNIRIDEIVAAAPVSGLKNWKINLKDKSADNMITETMVSQLPLLDDISKTHPGIKLTVHDYFEDILQMKTDEWIYESSSHWLHFSAATRHSLDKFPHIKNLAESGKRIGVIYGIDKPIICRGESGNLYTVVADPVVNIICPHFKDRFPNVESVLFYYSPDLPELMIKQAHEVCRFNYRPENSRVRSLLWDKSKSNEFNTNVDRGSAWQRSIIPCIYPAVKERFSVWQAVKQGMGFKGGFQMDNWILQLHGQEKFVQMVESDLNLFVKNIDTKYKHPIGKNEYDGFARFFKYWKIGHENNFKHTQDPVINNVSIIDTPL